MNRYIYYYTGPVQSGKTSKLSDWARNKNCAGILAPIINGKRHLELVSTGEMKELEVISSEKNKISVGRYCFSEDIFRWGRESLSSEFDKAPEWFIIDEYGKLEMKNKGLEPVITDLIKRWEADKKNNLLIVVRDYIVDDFISKFSWIKNSIKKFELN